MWTEECDKCFNYVKNQLKKPKLLIHPDFERAFIVTTGYNAKANGLCEKLNGIVKKYLLKYSVFVEREWDQWLHEACCVYKRK